MLSSIRSKRWDYFSENLPPAPDSISYEGTNVRSRQCAFLLAADEGELVDIWRALWSQSLVHSSSDHITFLPPFPSFSRSKIDMLRTYTVLGATGNVGGNVARVLLNKGHKTRVVLRNVESDRAQALQKAGAEPIASGFKADDEALGSLSIDEKILTSAFTNVDGVFAMLPPNLASTRPDEHVNEFMQIVKRAVINAKVKKLVLLSAAGAHLSSGTGQIEKMHRLEQVFSPLAGPDLRVVIVRPRYLFTSLMWSFGALPHGIFPFPYDKDNTRINMASPEDVGDEIAKQLMDTTQTSGLDVIELAGPQDFNFAEITDMVSEIVGKPIQYVRTPQEALVPTYTSFGISQPCAESLAAMDAATQNGTIVFEHSDKLVRGTRTLKDWLNATLKH